VHLHKENLESIVKKSTKKKVKYTLFYFLDINMVNFLFLSVFVAVLGFEFRASHLLGRHCTTLAALLALFCVGYFQDRVL
jgi:hypothetical protein